MNREFHGAQWEFINTSAYLTYAQFRVVVSTFRADTILWSIWDKSEPHMFAYDGKLVAHGSAANMPRALFQCETWLASQGKQ
jgi:hypothetical protein